MNAAPRDGHFVSRRLKLHYAEWGDPAAPPLLLVHGGRDHARSWDDVARALCSRWRVIAPDLRGHGDSEWAAGGYAMADFVFDLAVLVDTIGPAPLPIVAHSLGGNIALRYAALFPGRVSRLIAIEGLGPAPALAAADEAIDPADRLRRWIEKTRAVAARGQRSYADAVTAVARMRQTNPLLSDELARRLVAQGTRVEADGRLRFKFDPATIPLAPSDFSMAQKRALWARIACPVLLVYGRDSWASNPAEDGRVEAFRDARVALFEAAGHWVHHDRFDAFLAAAISFLEGPHEAGTD